ncbi:MAG: flagellar basal body rod C-terminal domain-containing protein [Dongiaceae bacterium]
MTPVLNIAVSGLRAAAKRLEVSASNVVNDRSTDYVPLRVQQTADADGGTRADTVPVRPASVPFFDPNDPAAAAARPNVSLEAEIVEQMLARRAFEANLRTIETAGRMTRALLDTLA